jgi:[CysO sulfur-carrier protein]-S-L-cysteine hydrolase
MTQATELPTGHPGPASATLPANLLEDIVVHLRAAYPNEGCGVILGDRSPATGGRATRFKPMRNADESPLRFTIADADLIALDDELDQTGENFWAIVHSHVASRAYPSETDVRVTPVFVNQLHLVVSLAAPEPVFGLFRIVDKVIYPVELIVGQGS